MTTNTFVPVPSHSSPRVLASTASEAPAAWARCRAMTFSAYDVDFTPATADFSLRVHGTVAIVVVAAHGVARGHRHDQRRHGVAAIAAERRRSRGVRDAQAPETGHLRLVGAHDLGHGSSDHLVVGREQPHRLRPRTRVASGAS